MAMAMCSAGAAPTAAARIISRPVEAWRSPAGATVSGGGGGGSVARLCSSFIGLSLRTRQESVRDIFPAPNAPAAPGKLCVTVSKMKTHKATAKRFRVTGSGKIMRRRAFRQHLLSKKSQRRKRRLAGMVQVKRSDYNNIIGALPYLNVKGRAN